ncbi:MAG: TrkH family potassium uptake protein [Christensenellaceae bacterium]|jgi:trk system potassium uptake protein TrkH|nr:TrkH family potassium uptake protein [Christensenellaceae bacterium]
MNYRMTAYILGLIAALEGILLIIPFVIALSLGESTTYFAFAITIGILLVYAIPFIIKKPKDTSYRARGGFVVVALAWIQLSVFGAMPFVISGIIPNVIEAFFESVSAFTTTGITMLKNPDSLPKSLVFWQLISQWIGGMGVLVFMVAIIPKNEPASVHLLKAETPGPQFGKIVSKLKFSARILYAIYIALTLLLVVLLLVGGSSVFDSFTLAFGTASTGGFLYKTTSLAFYDNIYFETIITIFMIIFAINFNLFYFVLIGHLKQAIKNEELRWMISIIVFATLVITIVNFTENVYNTFSESFRYSIFQVVSMTSSSGYLTTDFSQWPAFSQTLLILLMFIGGSSSSAAGGLKVSRLAILVKTGVCDTKKSISPRAVASVKMDGRLVSNTITASVANYFGMYMLIILMSWLLLSIDSNFDVYSNFTAAVSTMNNMGPAVGANGMVHFSDYSIFSKLVLVANMLIGRLEILPIILLVNPKSYLR